MNSVYNNDITNSRLASESFKKRKIPVEILSTDKELVKYSQKQMAQNHQMTRTEWLIKDSKFLSVIVVTIWSIFL